MCICMLFAQAVRQAIRLPAQICLCMYVRAYFHTYTKYKFKNMVSLYKKCLHTHIYIYVCMDESSHFVTPKRSYSAYVCMYARMHGRVISLLNPKAIHQRPRSETQNRRARQAHGIAGEDLIVRESKTSAPVRHILREACSAYLISSQVSRVALRRHHAIVHAQV
jgi:hypothetical protein